MWWFDWKISTSGKHERKEAELMTTVKERMELRPEVNLKFQFKGYVMPKFDNLLEQLNIVQN